MPNLTGRESEVLLTAGAVLTGSELLRPGWIEVSGSAVTAVGAG